MSQIGIDVERASPDLPKSLAITTAEIGLQIVEVHQPVCSKSSRGVKYVVSGYCAAETRQRSSVIRSIRAPSERDVVVVRCLRGNFQPMGW